MKFSGVYDVIGDDRVTFPDNLGGIDVHFAHAVAECPHPADDNPVVPVGGDMAEAAQVGFIGVNGEGVG
jgi:hypothetical protein